MRQFVYKLPSGGYTAPYYEKSVLDNKKCGLHNGRELFELVPREVVTVQEIR